MRTNHQDEALLTTNSDNRRVTASRVLAHDVTMRWAETGLLTSITLLAGLFLSRPLYGQEFQPLSLDAHITLPNVSGKTDDLFYDPARRRVYVLTAKGFLEVFEQKDADHYNRVARYPSPTGAQTGLFAPEWRKLFVAVPAQGEQGAEIRVYVTQ